MNDLTVLWTARLCVGCYLLRYVAAAYGGGRAPNREPRDFRKSPGSQRWLWTAGWGMLVVHTAFVFAFVHGWSHAAAVAHTARQTEALLGFSFGGGVWFNYAAIALWGADVARLWRHSQNPGIFPNPGVMRARVLWPVAVQAYLAMIIVSATAVFGPTFWWGVAAVFGLLIVVARLQARRERERPEDPSNIES